MIPVLERIENTISRYSMIPGGIRLGVAVSGGADSVFLLRILAARGGAPLTVLHVNHGLRGEASEGDATFVEALAAELGLPFIGHRMGAPSGNLEQCCRRERLAFFGRMIAESRVDRVATGHTASDQAETVLMRLLRGAGTTGLRGILPVTREGLVRPLLDVGRDEVRTWLREQGMAWREDASNASEVFLRNRVRKRLLPVMRELDGNVEVSLGRTAELALEDEEYWRQETEAVLARCCRPHGLGWVLYRRELPGMQPALAGRVLRGAMERALGSLRRIDRAHVEQVRRLALAGSGTGAVTVPGGRVVRSMDWLWITASGAWEAPGEQEFTVPGENRAGEYVVCAEFEAVDGYTEEGVFALDWEQLRLPLRLRTWKPGDHFRESGAIRARPVKEFFEAARVPSWDRAQWPIITDSDGIVWIHRFGAAAGKAATAATRVRLQVRCDTVSSK